MPIIISRKDAITIGARRYFTNKPCVRGHIVERHVSNNRCVVCQNLYRYKWELNQRGFLVGGFLPYIIAGVVAWAS